MRRCYICKEIKSLEEFPIYKKPCYCCKPCKKVESRKVRDKHKPDRRRYNKTGVPQSNKDYVRNRYHSDVNFKLSRLMRGRLNMAIRKQQKGGSAIDDLGCSISELKAHLEAQFQPGMTWENHGKYGWHIDHKKPLNSFDLTNLEQLREACHFSNLQPMWAKENYSKRDKIR